MLKQIRWLWENMDAPCRVRHVAALCISVLTCLMLLVNPALSQRLIDDVIVAQNPVLLLITKFFSKHVRPRFVFMREKLSEMNTAAKVMELPWAGRRSWTNRTRKTTDGWKERSSLTTCPSGSTQSRS